MNIFVTGATGFIGLNIVKALIDAGHSVVAYARGSSKVGYLNHFPIKLVRGELTDLNAVISAMSSCDAVIHCAGNTSCNRRDYEDLTTANVTSTRNIVAAAQVNNIKRIVYTSTTSTIGARPDGSKSGDEKTPLTGFRAKSPYAATKMVAEQALIEARDIGLEPVILNPAEVLGSYDHNLQWGRIVLAIASNALPFVPPGGGSFCSATDVAKAHVSALEKGSPGERYILAGHDTTFQDLFGVIGRVAGRKPIPQQRAPYPFLRLSARMTEFLSPITGKAPAVDSYRMRVFGNTYFFSSEKASRSLGYRSRSLMKMVTQSFSWYRKNGFI